MAAVLQSESAVILVALATPLPSSVRGDAAARSGFCSAVRGDSMTSHSLHLGGRLSGRWEGAHRGFRYTVVAYALAAFVQSCLTA